MEFKGIDISQHNANINWDNFKDIDFVILRAGYGKSINQKDKLFEKHYANATQRGKHVGVYWYSYAKTPAEAEFEAKCCLEIIKDHNIDYPVYFDMEERSQRNLGMTICSAMIDAFCKTIEAAGYSAGFYTNVDFYKNVINDHIKQRYTCWIAHWDVAVPAVVAPLWQYTVDKTHNVDMDIAYTDFSTWNKPKNENKPVIEYPIEIKIGDDVYVGKVTKK